MSSYAVVIGVNHYVPPTKKGLKLLEGAIPDAEAIAKWLKEKAGLPENNIRLLISTTGLDKIIKNHVDTAISEIIDEVIAAGGDADRLYFYFAGHGMGVENDLDNNGLCLSNWTESMFNSAAMASGDYKRELLTGGFFKEIVIWLDCCRNTTFNLRPQGGPGNNLRGVNNQPKWFLAHATTYDTSAYETTYTTGALTEKRGIFTKVLLDGLNGAAGSGGRAIDALSLSDYLYIHVPKAAQQAGFAQEPDISHNTSAIKSIYFP